MSYVSYMGYVSCMSYVGKLFKFYRLNAKYQQFDWLKQRAYF